jgi:hypothetical protein
MTKPFNLYDNPVYLKWQAATIEMVMRAQWAENTVAMIDGREPRHAEIDVVSLEEIRVILVDRPPRLADE